MREFKYMVSKNMIQNCPINASGVTNAHIMVGTNLSSTRINTVQQKLDRVVMEYVAVHKDFLKFRKFVTLVVNLMFVNSVPLLITRSCGIKFVTVEKVPTRADKQFIKSLKG